ncbi:hypothetical protein KAR91_74825 [Candidatus Pacearchaeota archaeon]|nr:hypothetical protein [Candidatus Pacearchaeota archaeon]
MLGKSISTVKRMIKNDPYFPKPWKRKRTVRFRKHDIEKYVKYLESKVQIDKVY